MMGNGYHYFGIFHWQFGLSKPIAAHNTLQGSICSKRRAQSASSNQSCDIYSGARQLGARGARRRRALLRQRLNGPLYILDKKTKELTAYLDFNGRDDRPGSSTDCSTNRVRQRRQPVPVRSRLPAERQVLHGPHREPALAGLETARRDKLAGLTSAPATRDAPDRHAGTDPARIGAHRVDRHEHLERDLRRHGPRVDAACS